MTRPDARILSFLDNAGATTHLPLDGDMLPAEWADAARIVDLCEDRAHFFRLLAATLQAGRDAVLPPDNRPATLKNLTADGQTLIGENEDLARWPTARPAGEQPAGQPGDIVLYTSGSTGSPQAHRKSLANMLRAADGVKQRLTSLLDLDDAQVIATVPAQHMFGLEMTIMLPLAAGWSVHRGKPLMPADVHAALSAAAGPRVLVSTPMHLRALLRADMRWPETRLILSATAPLDPALARDLEQAFDATVVEIYGSTETGAIATRRTARQLNFTPLDGVTLSHDGDAWHVQAPYLDSDMPLGDVLRFSEEGDFSVEGRLGDMIKVAGKRTSLAYLNQKIAAIDGVVDAVYLPPDTPHPDRLAAVVVAPALDNRSLLAALREHVDPVFLPRPIHRVDCLPRNATGKITRDALMKMIND